MLVAALVSRSCSFLQWGQIQIQSEIDKDIAVDSAQAGIYWCTAETK